MQYYVIETQTTNGVGSVAFSQTYSSQQSAFKKYHQLLAVAEESQVDYHLVFIVDEDLTVLAYELAKRNSYPNDTPVWFVLEFQTGENSGTIIPLAYTDKSDGWAKFYQILQYAAKSSVPKHGVIIMSHTFGWYKEMLAEREEEPEEIEEQ